LPPEIAHKWNSDIETPSKEEDGGFMRSNGTDGFF
jgi:hypothetical protein